MCSYSWIGLTLKVNELEFVFISPARLAKFHIALVVQGEWSSCHLSSIEVTLAFLYRGGHRIIVACGGGWSCRVLVLAHLSSR